jgi:hypothetical protein
LKAKQTATISVNIQASGAKESNISFYTFRKAKRLTLIYTGSI